MRVPSIKQKGNEMQRMTDIKLLNDPEYRWYHKDEMSKIMPYTSIRNAMKIKIIDYEKLRKINSYKIKPCKTRKFDWNCLNFFVNEVPYDLGEGNKKSFSPADRLHFERRDKGVCAICGQINRYGSSSNGNGISHLHHVIPNGSINDNNVITLCLHCHQVVHLLLYIDGRWKYSRPLWS